MFGNKVAPRSMIALVFFIPQGEPAANARSVVRLLSKGTVRGGGQLLFCFIVLYFVVNESVRYGNNIISEMLHI